jgi:hypothetical protein
MTPSRRYRSARLSPCSTPFIPGTGRWSCWPGGRPAHRRAGGASRQTGRLQEGTVEVAENLTLDNGRPAFGPLKTKASHRKVPIPRQTLAALEDHVQRFGVGRDDLLFTSVEGSILRPYQFRRRHFHVAAARCGLAPLRPHDLRHSAISLWIASGTNPKVVHAKAGHASIKVTYDRYGRLFPDYDDKATRHLENLWDEAAGETNVVALPSRDDTG